MVAATLARWLILDHNCEVFYIPERFFQSNVISSDGSAMDTSGAGVGSVGSVGPGGEGGELAPDKPPPELRSP